MSPGALVVTERVGFAEAWELQRRLVEARREKRVPDVVWLLEHPPTYTTGRHGSRIDLLLDDAGLAARGARFHAIDRGGQMTWHGPGQTTGYVVADLRPGGRVHAFVAALVEAMRRASGLPTAQAGAAPAGLYVERRKLGSVGIRVSSGITSHGLALNRDVDLAWFAPMTACGAPDVATTSIVSEGGDPDRTRVEGELAAALGDLLGLRLSPARLEDLLRE